MSDDEQTDLHLSAEDMTHPEQIPSVADAQRCAVPYCPGPEGFKTGYGLAGGGLGPYVWCHICEEVRGKDQK